MRSFLNKITSNFMNMTHEEYVTRLERHGKAGLKVLDAADKNDLEGVTPAGMRALYRAKNKSPNVSYLVTGFCNWEIYSSIMKCLIEHLNLDQPRSVLELGCDNGMLTLCMAEQWPKSKFFGIDRESISIDVAKRISNKYSEQKVGYRKVDLCSPNTCEKLPEFDLIIAPFIFHEIIKFEQNLEALVYNLKQISALGAQLVSFDRFPHPELQLPNLDRILEMAEFQRTSGTEIETSLESFPASFYRKLHKNEAKIDRIC